VSRVLIVRLDGIGDALVCTPLIAGLRAAGHELGIALSDRNAGIFAPQTAVATHVLERIPWPQHGSTPASRAQADAEIAAQACLVGQPVALGQHGPHPIAALRICAGARLVTETWSSDANTAYRNLQRELDNVSAIVAKIEWLLGHSDDLKLTEVSRGA